MKIIKRASIFLLMFMQIFTVNALADAPLYDIKPYDAVVYVVTPDGGLNLRSGPGSSYTAITKIPDYEILHVTEIDMTGQWGHVQYKGMYGFVYLNQTSKKLPVKEVSYDVTITSPDGYLNWRNGPRSSYQIIDVLTNGTKLHIRGELNGFGLIHHNDEIGWIYLGETTKVTAANSSNNNAQQNSANNGQAVTNKQEDNISKQETVTDKVEETSSDSKKEENAEEKSTEAEEESGENENSESVDSSDKGSNKYIIIGSIVVLIVAVAISSIIIVNKMRG